MNLLQECSTWCAIAQVREKAGESVEDVMRAYNRAAALAESVKQPKKMVSRGWRTEDI